MLLVILVSLFLVFGLWIFWWKIGMNFKFVWDDGL